MTGEPVTYAELLASLSHALDLVEGQPAGHAERTCLIAVQTGRVLGLGDDDLARVFFASLLKDTGCSNNSARMHKIFGGDEILCKREVKFVDWSDPLESVKFGFKYTEHGGTVGQKLRRMVGNLAAPRQVVVDVTAARCNRGAQIALELGFDEEVSRTIAEVDEHWDGRGAPLGLSGDSISFLARVVGASQTLEVFATAFGLDAAFEMLTKRSGSWFDPEVVTAARSLFGDVEFWRTQRESAHGATLCLDLPSAGTVAQEADIDSVCRAYAGIIDAKSAFTGEHSTRVTEYAVAIGSALGIEGERLATLRRAALLHDIGKLGVSNQILDKPGRLDESEFGMIRLHPYYTHQILRPIARFATVAEVAASHHERLDGKGYWRGYGAEDLTLDMRCLTAADVFDALSADRPYRAAMPMAQVFDIMDSEAGSGLDPRCIDVLKDVYGAEWPIAA